jgi:hypothetical protein
MQTKRTVALSAALLANIAASQAIAASPPIPNPLGNWFHVSDNNGAVPSDAIVGGHEKDGRTPLYVCKALWIDPRGFVTGPHPGQVRPGLGGPSLGGCQITHHESNSRGQPETPFVNDYDVLVPSWQSASRGYVPPNATDVGGCDTGGPFCGPKLYVCRAVFLGGLHVGKIRSGFPGCYFESLGKNQYETQYEVLVDQTPTLPHHNVSVGPGAQIPPDALVGGYEVRLVHPEYDKRYICLAPYRGSLQPGEAGPGINGCNIEYGFKGSPGITVQPPFDVVVPNWAAQPGILGTYPAYDFPIAKDGSASIYACNTGGLNDGSVHIGEWRQGWYRCHFGNDTAKGPEREYAPIELLSSTVQYTQ